MRFDTGLARMQDNIFNMYAFDKAEKVIYADEPLYRYSVEHISRYGAAYDERVKTYVPGIIGHRRAYLERTGLMADAEMHRFYLQESAGLMIGCLFKYFLHREWNVTTAERKKGIKHFFQDEIYREVLDGCTRICFKAADNQLEIPFRQRIALLLLKHGCVSLMLMLEKMRRVRNSFRRTHGKKR